MSNANEGTRINRDDLTNGSSRHHPNDRTTTYDIVSRNRGRRRRRHEQQHARPHHECLLLMVMVLAGVVAMEVIVVELLVFQGKHSFKIFGMTTNDVQQRDEHEIRRESDNVEKEEPDQESSLGPLHKILERAGVEVTPQMKRDLPPPSQVEDLYGRKGPVILGLETCQRFRDSVKPEDAFIGPAGMFNTGTNLIDVSLGANCYIPQKVAKYGKMSKGMRMQVPWGKHNPVALRGKHVAKMAGAKVNQTNFLPIVAIKDPYTWMSSLCRHHYTAHWVHSDDHCPSLVPLTPLERTHNPSSDSIPVNVKYTPQLTNEYRSLAHLWNTWNNEWVNADFPRLIVRFEDLLFRLEDIITQACTCGGGVMRPEFQYQVGAAKTQPIHKGSSGLMEALLRYSNATLRTHDYKPEDLEFARSALDEDLMRLFHYPNV